MTSMRLDEVAQINPKLAKSLAADTLVSFLPMSAVDADRGTTTLGEERQYSEVSKGYTYFENGDLLIAKITPCFENGKIAQATLSHPVGFGSTEFHVVRVNADRLDERYLLHFLRQRRLRLEGEKKMTGSGGQKRVPANFIKELELPVPSLQEQKRIAAILDKADALRAKRCKALEQLDALAQAIFIEMFGADECPFFELGEALEFITSGGRGWAKYYSEQGARFIRSYDVQMNHISDAEPIYVAAPDNAEARRTIVRQGDVLLTITGSKIGRVSPVSKKFDGAYVSQHVAILRGDACRIDSDFLSYYLSLPAGGQRQIEKSQYGQTKPGLNFEQIKKFRVPDVSIEIQREFTRRLKAIEELRQAQTRHLVASESLFSSLQHRAFRGEL